MTIYFKLNSGNLKKLTIHNNFIKLKAIIFGGSGRLGAALEDYCIKKK